ncbi:MAG: hypothetical protein N2203_08020, partial [Bacteroidia bacterium]|nr:hypothetical protein [Bacteroidia bacterium]
MFRITAYLSLFIVLNSCKTQHAFVSEPLMNSGIIYEVTNRQALHWFKDMYIGKEFVAYKIKRSWTEGYHFPFILRFSGVKEKFSFMLKNTDSSETTMKAISFCLDKIQEQELPQFIPYPFPLNYENIFSGKIILLGDTSYQALFAISEPPYIMFKGHISEGHL